MSHPAKPAVLPRLSSVARRQLARASTIATSKFLSPRQRERTKVKPITLRLPKPVAESAT